MGSEKVVFLVIFIHPFENSGGYFFRGRLFWWILDINLQNFVRGYFSKFSLRGLPYSYFRVLIFTILVSLITTLEGTHGVLGYIF